MSFIQVSLILYDMIVLNQRYETSRGRAHAPEADPRGRRQHGTIAYVASVRGPVIPSHASRAGREGARMQMQSTIWAPRTGSAAMRWRVPVRTARHGSAMACVDDEAGAGHVDLRSPRGAARARVGSRGCHARRTGRERERERVLPPGRPDLGPDPQERYILV